MTLNVPALSAADDALVLPTIDATAMDLPPLPPVAPQMPGALAGVTVPVVQRMFPETPERPIAANLPQVLRALAAAGLTDAPMLLAALGTIRAEAECFEPVSEGVSHFNTSPGGAPFDLYDHHPGLGNQGPPDGEQFRGRGFVQLTGRANYTHYAQVTGLDLVNHPELACDAAVAGTLLARFLADRAEAIRGAFGEGDLARARRLVNGGTNGLDRFEAAVRIGTPLLEVAAVAPHEAGGVAQAGGIERT